MSTALDGLCPSCSSVALKLTAESAFHDVTLIDIVATCDECGLVLNAFVSIEEMSVVPQEEA